MSDTITLHRFCHSEEMGTFGWMMIAGYKTFTVERPWKDNKPFISCIPTGLYHVERHRSPKFGMVWILEGGTVSKYEGERTHILLHSGNRMTDLSGCIAPGLTLTALGGKWAVGSSRNAMSRIANEMPDRWDLHITHGRG